MTTPADIIKAFDDCLDYVFGRSRGRDYPSKFDEKVAQEWIDEGLTTTVACFVFYHQMSRMHERWLHYPATDKTNIPQHLGVFEENIRAGIQRFKAGGEPIAVWEQTLSQWQARINGFILKPELWLVDQWGPPPGADGCRVPKATLAYLAERQKKTSRNR